MPNFYLCLLLAGFCVLVSCHHVPGHDEHQQAGHDEHPQAERHQEGGHLPCLKIAPNNADFAFRFYRQVASEAADNNIFFSPVSISSAFMLLTLGANGTTSEEIFSGLGFNRSVISEKEIDAGFHHFLQYLNRPNAHIELSLGNALFSDDRFPLQQGIVDEARDLLQADIVHSNFQNPEEAVNQINSYIEKKTHGKLEEVLKDLNPETALVLISYNYLQAYWEKPFDPESTRKTDFFVNNETTVQVDMMHRDGYYHTYHDEELGCEVVRVPYQGNASALFILPEKGKLNQVEQGLKQETLLKWERSARQQRIKLSLPRVSLRTNFDVVKIFKGLGVTEVFTDRADLSYFTKEHKLKVSKAFHKTYLNIHENGTEAAAATVIEMVPMSLPPEVTFDRPFLFMVFEHNTRFILFYGRVINPNEH